MIYLIIPLIVVVIVIWMLVVFPSFRVVAIILALLGAGTYLVLSNKAAHEQKQQAAVKAKQDQQFAAEQRAYCQAEQKRWTIVPASQIELRNPSLTEVPYSGGDYTVTVAAKNKSKAKVTALRLSITAFDCPTQNARPADCDVVGRGHGMFVAGIPGGEVRQVTGKITMADVPKPRGVFSPRFVVDAVRAPISEADDTPANDLLGMWGYKCN